MNRILAQTRKELTQFLRDRLALALALGLPLIQLMLMGPALSLSVKDMPLVVQDLDQTHASRELIDAFRASQTFRIVPWAMDREPEDALSSNVARAVLIIPPRYGRDVARGTQSPVQLLVDGTDANTARLLTGYATGVVRGSEGPTPASRPEVRPAIRLWYNPGLSSKRFYGPGIFVLALSMFPPLLATLAMAREGEVKTILQVYASNIRAHEFLLGKIFAFVVVALAECLVLIVPLYLYFEVRLVGDPTPLLAATVCYGFCVASFGTLVGAAIPNQMAALQAVMFGGFLLVFMLSGLLFPISNIPVSLRWLSNFVWGRYYIEIVRDVFLKGGGWPVNGLKVLVLAGFGGLFYGVAWRTMRRMQLAA